MSSKIIDIEGNLERIKEFFEFSANKLDFNSTKIKIKDEWGAEEIIEFKEAMKKLVTYYQNRKYPLVGENALFVLNSIPGRLYDVKEKLDESFEELVKMLDVQNQAIEELQEELQLKEGELKEKDDKIDMLREEMQNNKFEQMQQQINNLTMSLINPKSLHSMPHKSPDSYFTEEIETPIGDDEPAVQINPINDIPKIQQAHDEILEIMRGEGLYPLHKAEDLQRARETYIEMWSYVIPRYGLDENDYPSFIDSLHSYKDKDDDYLDNVEV